MEQHEVIIRLVKEHSNRSQNEADTRVNIIDEVIHAALDWPKAAVKRELSVDSGYADYVLSNAAGRPTLVVEAKREGVYFSLPNSTPSNKAKFTSVRTLITDQNLKSAIEQARNYCLDIGCSFGCITNGHEWVFFRAFEPGVDWKSLRAYVIPSLEAMASSFSVFYNALSYREVCYGGGINSLLSKTSFENRDTYRAGNEIVSYKRTIQANKYAQYLRPIAERFFGQIDASQSELMNACYVSDQNYESVFRSAGAILVDSITPYLESYGVRDTENNDGGGAFGNRIEKSIIRDPRADVVVLFGGKGIGKSTFLRRLLYVSPPQVLKKNAAIAFIDLLNVPEEKHSIDKAIWKSLISQMDVDKILDGDREGLLLLFRDKYEVAKKQDLFGIPEDSIDFNKKLNELVAIWKSDHPYVARRLSDLLKKKHKGVIVIIDNTDQFSALQEYCFTHAQSIANELKCLVIISMREERFYSSTIHGVLDAFQNSGFHLSSPPSQNVFLKRIDYVLKLISEEGRRDEFLPYGADGEAVRSISTFFRNLRKEFRSHNSHLSGFLSACAHGNIRLALELFRGLMQSRYINIDEITSNPTWTWQIHQVLKPVMIPNRFYYDESESHVPNIFQLRSKKVSSHFTTLRVLSALGGYGENKSAAFISLAQLVTEHANRFNMEEDVKSVIDVLLRYGLIESDNRVDEYSESIDLIRITSYGSYLASQLSSAFTYLEMVSTDTSIFDSRVSAELARLAMGEFDAWDAQGITREKRIQRVEIRIQKAVEFVQYLEQEEERESTLFSLSGSEKFTPEIKRKLLGEVERVRNSARRQRY